MPRSTKYLTFDAALAFHQNCSWFAGFKHKIRKLGSNRYQVTAPDWVWSNFCLIPEDFAKPASEKPL